MRKILGVISTITLTSTASLQITACTDDSKFKDFMIAVNSNNAFFGIIGAADDPLTKRVIDCLTAMQRKINVTDQFSPWEEYLNNKKREIDTVTNDGKIGIKIFEKASYANPGSNLADYFWNDKKISWQKQIYHWLLDHANNPSFVQPNKDSGVEEITKPTDKERKFTDLPIVFIINKGQLWTFGKKWSNSGNFFEQFTNLIDANLLKHDPN